MNPARSEPGEPASDPTDGLFPEFKTKEEELEFDLWFLRQQLFQKMRRPPDASMRRKLQKTYEVEDWYKHFLERRKGRRTQFKEGTAELRRAIAVGDAVGAAVAMLRLMEGIIGSTREFEDDQIFEMAFRSRTARANKARACVTDKQIVDALTRRGSVAAAAVELGISRQAICKRIPKERRNLLLQAFNRE